MENCFRCERSEKEVRLLDAIYGNDFVKVCERCSITENIPVIKRPSTSQLKDSEKAFSVYQRLKKLGGKEEKKEKPESISEQIKKLEENPELEMPEEKRHFNLIDNFNWAITRARRNKGLSQRQLGWALSESEAAIKILEKGELPEDAEMLIKKLEQFFQIKLREKTEEETAEERRKENVHARMAGSEIQIESEEPAESKEADELELISSIATGKIAGEDKTFGETPLEALNFQQGSVKKVTVADLKLMQEEKFKEEKLARDEEERRKASMEDSAIKEEINKGSRISRESDEKRKLELKEEVAEEMKGLVLGKTRQIVREEKQKKKDEKECIPSIYELMERKKERDRAKMQENIEAGKAEPKAFTQ